MAHRWGAGLIVPWPRGILVPLPGIQPAAPASQGRFITSRPPGGSDSEASAYNVGDLGSVPGLERSPGEGNGNPLQYSCLEKSMDGGVW